MGWRRWLGAFLLAGFCTGIQGAERTQQILEAEEQGQSLVGVSLTTIYQRALEAEADHGNYEIDLYGTIRLRASADASRVGDSRVNFWALSVDNLGSLRSASELAEEAGLLWPTNDLDTDEAFTSIVQLSFAQRFLDDAISLHVGKLWQLFYFYETRYTGDNTSSYLSRILANDMVGRYSDLAGLGVYVDYVDYSWLIKGAAIDAQAIDDFDFESLGDGNLAYTLEGGWYQDREHGSSDVMVLLSTIDDTPDFREEQAVSLSFSHDVASGNHAFYGRYTWRDGGEPTSLDGLFFAKPLTRGGYLGWTWNRAFGSDAHRVAAAFMQGEPTELRELDGFVAQHGVEVYWKYSLGNWLEVTTDLQFVRNLDDDLELIPGVRLRLGKALKF